MEIVSANNSAMNEDATTSPPIETVLERINALGAEFTARFNALESEVKEGFDAMNRRIVVISIDINKMRSDIRRLEGLVEKLDKQPA